MDDDYDIMDVNIVSIICVMFFIVVSICLVSFVSFDRKGTGTNMNNETKEYVGIYEDKYRTYGVTEDGTRELLKSYKYKK